MRHAHTFRDVDNRTAADILNYQQDRIRALAAIPLDLAQYCAECRHLFVQGPTRCPKCDSAGAFFSARDLIEASFGDRFR